MAETITVYGHATCPGVPPLRAMLAQAKVPYTYVNNNLLNSQYVRCINNRQFIRMKGEEPPDEAIYGLTIGKVYKRLPDARAEQHGMIRVIDESYGEPGSEQGYMFPAAYFEPLDTTNVQLAEIVVRVPAYVKDILHAEAVATDQSVAALLRGWIDERLDLPEG